MEKRQSGIGAHKVSTNGAVSMSHLPESEGQERYPAGGHEELCSRSDEAQIKTKNESGKYAREPERWTSR